MRILQAGTAAPLPAHPVRRLLPGVERLRPIGHRIARHARHHRHAARPNNRAIPGREPTLLLVEMTEHKPEKPHQVFRVNLHNANFTPAPHLRRVDSHLA